MEITKETLSKVLEDINSVSTQPVTGDIVEGDYIELDSAEFTGVIQVSRGVIKYCLYHKNYNIISIDKDNIFDAFNSIITQLKNKSKEYDDAFKKM